MADQNDGGAPGQDYSHFPNGISITGYGSVPSVLYPPITGVDYLCAIGTVVVPAGAAGTAFVPSVGGQVLGSASFCLATPYGDLGAGTAYAGVFASVGGGGTVTLIGVSGAGTASAASGTATYQAFGTY